MDVCWNGPRTPRAGGLGLGGGIYPDRSHPGRAAGETGAYGAESVATEGALPCAPPDKHAAAPGGTDAHRAFPEPVEGLQDRKSTRLNSSHSQISYAVFC